MLGCLSSRERDIFEMHFFRQLSPTEIGSSYRMTTNHVYQTLSRSRKKVKEERFRLSLSDLVHENKVLGQPVKRLLPFPNPANPSVVSPACETSFVRCIHAVLRHSGFLSADIDEVMGMTTQAFRIQVEKRSIDVSGPSMYFWEPVFANGLQHMGVTCRCFGDGGVEPSSHELSLGLGMIREAIGRNMPAVAWDLFEPEFSVLYGYDDERMLLYAEHGGKRKELPYDRLGRGSSGGLFIISLENVQSVNRARSLRQALHMILGHAYGERGFSGYAYGLAAYEAWKLAFERGAVDAFGNAYTSKITANARRFAVRFLEAEQRRWEGEAALLLEEAAEHYRDAADFMHRLTEMFPFPQGGSPNDPLAARQSVWLLQEAREAEEAGLEALDRLRRVLGLVLM